MKQHPSFDFDETRLDEQLEQLERGIARSADRPAARAYTSLKELYAPTRRSEEQAIERVHQRLISRIYSQTLSPRQLMPGKPVDARTAFFQKKESERDEPTEVDTLVDLPALVSPTLQRRHKEQRARKRRLPLWGRALAAVLVVAILISSFVAIQALYRAKAPHTNVVAPPSVCQPSPWQISSTSATGLLFSVAASSPGDAWAVGETFDQNPLIEHWDGVKWHVMSSPQLRGKSGYLQVIAIVAPNDIWAAGEQFQRRAGPAGGPVGEVSGSATLIEHWDGKNWALVASPESKPDPQSATAVNSITVVSAHNIWIAGAWINHGLNPNTQTALLEHWDGQKWTRVLDQSVLENGTSAGAILYATTNAGDQVLAAGTQIGIDQVYHAYLERWNGQQWQQVDVSSLGPHAVNITALSAVSASDMWAIVEKSTSAGGSSVKTIVHWDGQTWKQISAPGWLVGKNTSTWRILALGPRNVWAMNASPSVLARWDGTSWKQIKLPDSALHLDTFTTGLAVSASATWVVGRIVDGSSIRPLLEQRITC